MTLALTDEDLILVPMPKKTKYLRMNKKTVGHVYSIPWQHISRIRKRRMALPTVGCSVSKLENQSKHNLPNLLLQATYGRHWHYTVTEVPSVWFDVRLLPGESDRSDGTARTSNSHAPFRYFPEYKRKGDLHLGQMMIWTFRADSNIESHLCRAWKDGHVSQACKAWILSNELENRSHSSRMRFVRKVEEVVTEGCAVEQEAALLHRLAGYALHDKAMKSAILKSRLLSRVIINIVEFQDCCLDNDWPEDVPVDDMRQRLHASFVTLHAAILGNTNAREMRCILHPTPFSLDELFEVLSCDFNACPATENSEALDGRIRKLQIVVLSHLLGLCHDQGMQPSTEWMDGSMESSSVLPGELIAEAIQIVWNVRMSLDSNPQSVRLLLSQPETLLWTPRRNEESDDETPRQRHSMQEQKLEALELDGYPASMPSVALHYYIQLLQLMVQHSPESAVQLSHELESLSYFVSHRHQKTLEAGTDLDKVSLQVRAPLFAVRTYRCLIIHPFTRKSTCLSSAWTPRVLSQKT